MDLFYHEQPNSARARTLAWATCSAIAVLIEGGKLFFAGRAPNVDNVVFSTLGALGGVVLVPPLATTALVRQHARQMLIILILCIIAYAELSPFDCVRSLEQIPFRIAMIEWLPFSSYYVAEPRAALFDLAKKLFLFGPLGFVIAAGNRDGSSRKPQALAAAAGLLIGLILEAGQIALQSRTPSMTDVLLFGGAAWTGAMVCERYRRIRDAST